MRRPGPRPYECVRRAWHSDRHQPMRGSLIQEIFRVVNEIHSSATKKNKEWQEKLPNVVLKAEEIMYSKANSEAEYMDLKTLWERLNDAINTIIRRDESTETGEFLQPCIEAALNLGCIPRRASRSQRHNNPRFYLSPNTQEPTSIVPKISNNTTTQQVPPHLLSNHPSNQATIPWFMPHYPTFTRPTTLNSSSMVSESCSPPIEIPFSSENFHQSGNNPSIAIAMSSLSNMGCVYPLYYGFPIATRETQLNLQPPEDPNSSIVVAASTACDQSLVDQSLVEPAEMSMLQDLFSHNGAVNASNSIIEMDFRNTSKNPPETTDCDLSLRLGVLAVPCATGENNWSREVEDTGSSSSEEGSPKRDKEFHFFPNSSKRRAEGEDLNVDASIRKRKAPVSDSGVDGQFSWQPSLPSTQSLGRTKGPGS